MAYAPLEPHLKTGAPEASGHTTSRLPVLILLAGALALYLPCLASLPLIRIEALYALIPQEMLASGRWLTPVFNGARYLDKPPLLYWINALVYGVAGLSEGTARLANALFLLGELWLTCLIGRRLLTPRATRLGTFVLLSSLGFFVLHLQLLTDHLITLSLLSALYALVRWQEAPAGHWLYLFYLSLAAGFMSKGLIGLAFPVLIGAAYALLSRQPRSLGFFFSLKGWLLVALLTAPWLIAMESANPGFLWHQVVNEQILRFFGQRRPPDINSYSLAGFWLFLGLWLLPWTLLLPEALYRLWRDNNPAPDRRAWLFLLTWAGVVMAFFSLSGNRVEYYSLPALPALALLIGRRLDRALDAPRDLSLTFALAAVALLAAAAVLLAPLLEPLVADNRREFLGLATLVGPVARRVAVVLPALALAGVLAGWRRPRLALAAYGALALALLFFTFKALLALSPLMSDKIPGEYLRQAADPADLAVMEHIEEYEYGASLAFYSGRRLLLVQRRGLPQFPYPVSPGENYLIAPERLREVWASPRRLFLLVDDGVEIEPFLQNAAVALDLPGKRLLVNRPPEQARAGTLQRHEERRSSPLPPPAEGLMLKFNDIH